MTSSTLHFSHDKTSVEVLFLGLLCTLATPLWAQSRVYGPATRETAVPSSQAMQLLPPADDQPIAAAAWETSLVGDWGYGGYYRPFGYGYGYAYRRPWYAAPYRYNSYYRPWYTCGPSQPGHDW